MRIRPINDIYIPRTTTLHADRNTRVDAKPVKQALSTWVTKWMFVFTNFLQDRLFHSLEELHGFMSEIDVGLDQEVEEAARMADIHTAIMGFPDKYDTVVGERGLKLQVITYIRIY